MTERVVSVRLFFDDFESGIVELKPVERAVYLTICLRFYATFGHVKDDDRTLANASNCTLQAYRKAKKVLIERGKIEVVDGLIIQHKCAKELADAQSRLRKWKLWKSKKDAKKIEKTSQFEPENPNDFREGRSTSVAVGYGTPKGVNRNLHGEKSQNLGSTSADSSPPCEDGRSLSAVGRELINDIWTACGTAMSLRNRDALKASIVSAEDRTLTVKQDWWEAPGNQYFVDKADGAGVVIQPAGAEIVNLSERKATA